MQTSNFARYQRIAPFYDLLDLAFERRRSTTQEGTDLWAIYSGRISVTPLYLDLTHRPLSETLKDVLGE